MSQKQRQIFTSTPHKRTYLYNTGQGILKSQQSQTRNLSDSVNPAASRIYRVVLWSSENTGHTSKKTKKKGTTTNKQQMESQCASSQNPDKEDSLNSGTCDKSQLKIGDHFVEGEQEEENKKPKLSRRERRDKYKLEVNKEIQKWFSQNFNDNNRKDPHHPRNQGRVTEKIKRLDTKALKVCQKNYKRSSRDVRMKNKDKCEDDPFLKSGDQIDEDAKDCHHTNDSSTDEDDSSKNNETGDLFDIWDLSEDKNPDSLNLSKAKNTKTKNKSHFNKTQRGAKNAKTVPSLPPLDPSQIYEFPQSPNADKSKATDNKSKATHKKSRTTHKKSKTTHNKSKSTPGKSNAKGEKKSSKKKNLKDDLVVNEILNIISKTKIEIESMKAKILKQKTKYK